MAEVAQRPATGQHILTAVEAVEETASLNGTKLDRLLAEVATLDAKVSQLLALLAAERTAPRVRHAGPADWRG